MTEKTEALVRLENHLKTALGMDVRGNVYKNSYCAKNGTPEYKDWCALERAGFAVKHRLYEGYTYFKVAQKGALHLKVTKKDFSEVEKLN